MRYVLLFLVCLASVQAFGISQDFHANSTIVVQPGVAVKHRVNIQNDLPENISVLFTITGKYTSVKGKQQINITVPAQSADTYIFIDIAVPTNITAGSVFPQEFSVQPFVERNGTVSMAVRLRDSFIVQVAGEPPKKNYVPYVLAGIAALLILYGAGVGARKAAHWIRTRPKKSSGLVVGGMQIKNVAQLATMLEHFSESAFEREVLSRKAEVAAWVFAKTKDPEVYHRVKVARTRASFIQALK